MVNGIENITTNSAITDAVKAIVMGGGLSALADLIKDYARRGYFGKKAMGIYADSVTAATLLATLSGAWFKDVDGALVGRGGSGGYYHFHDLARTIHIWYGDRIA